MYLAHFLSCTLSMFVIAALPIYMIFRRLLAGPKDGRSSILRALFEQSELVRSPLASVHWRWPDWASMVLGHFAETKGPRLPGRDPAT